MIMDIVVEVFDLVGVGVWSVYFDGSWQIKDDFMVWFWLLYVYYGVIDFDSEVCVGLVKDFWRVFVVEFNVVEVFVGVFDDLFSIMVCQVNVLFFVDVEDNVLEEFGNCVIYVDSGMVSVD